MITSKKAQVTLYIILGIVILSGALLYFSQEEISPQNIEIEEIQEQTAKTASADTLPVLSMVQACLTETGEDGLRLIGSHAGYINPSDLLQDGSGNTFFGPQHAPTAGNAIPLTEKALVPYWDYVEGLLNCRAECQYANEVPALEGENDPLSIESQLTTYMEIELESCITTGAAQLSRSGYNFDLEEVSVDLLFTEEDIQARVTYPMKISKDGASFSYAQFAESYPLNIRQFYSLAAEITNFQRQYQFFERNTIALISAHGGVQPGQLPPLAHYTVERSAPPIWIKSQVRDDLQDIIAAYVPFYSVQPSKNFQIYDVGNVYGNGLLKRFYMPLGFQEEEPEIRAANPAWNDMEVTFTYLPSWPIYMDLKGEGVQGELITPTTFTSSFPLLSVYQSADLEVNYDVSYPLLVSIYDPDAMGGKGYRFNFGLEVNMQNNNDPQYVFEGEDGGIVYPVSAAAGTNEIVCNLNQRISDPATFRTIDGYSNRELEDVRLTYSCGQECLIGYTEKDGLKSTLTAKLPKCFGGLLKPTAPGYVSNPLIMNTAVGTPSDEVLIEMMPIKEITHIKVKKYMNRMGDEIIHDAISKHPFELDSFASEFGPHEEAFVIITPITPGQEGLLPMLLKYSLGEEELEVPLQIAPGKYRVEIHVLDKQKSVIPGRWSCFNEDMEKSCNEDGMASPDALDSITSDSGVPIDVADLGAVVTGQQVSCEELDLCQYMQEADLGDQFFKGSTTIEWEVTNGIYRGEAVQFYAITSPDGFNHDSDGNIDLLVTDLEQMGTGELLVEEYRTRLEPRILRHVSDLIE